MTFTFCHHLASELKLSSFRMFLSEYLTLKLYEFFLRLFLNGIHLPIDRLYPAVSFPVSRGTQMVAPLVLWDHSQDWFSGEYDEKANQVACERKFVVNLKDEDTAYMSGHIIDGTSTDGFLRTVCQ